MTEGTDEIGRVFIMRAAKSKGTDEYSQGSVPFVTSAEVNNGVVAYVEPEETDKVFIGPAVAISGLGYATVHVGKFLPKGNGGDSLTVLRPREEMFVKDLVSFAAIFNMLHKWRFSYGRKASIQRLKHLKVPFPLPNSKGAWSLESTKLSSINEFVATKINEEAPYGEELKDEEVDSREDRTLESDEGDKINNLE